MLPIIMLYYYKTNENLLKTVKREKISKRNSNQFMQIVFDINQKSWIVFVESLLCLITVTIKG